MLSAYTPNQKAVGFALNQGVAAGATGDYLAAIGAVRVGERRVKELVDKYGVHFDPALRDEIVARVDQLQLPSYTGFVMPRLDARRDEAGNIVDVEISYPCDLETQMLEYSAFARRDDVLESPSAAR